MGSTRGGLRVTMNQQLKDGERSVWQLCPLTHTPTPQLPPSHRDLPGWAVLEGTTGVGTDGMGWIRIPAGTHRGRPGRGRCSLSPPRVPSAVLRSLEAPAGASGAALAGRSRSTASPAWALRWVQVIQPHRPCQHGQPNPTETAPSSS